METKEGKCSTLKKKERKGMMIIIIYYIQRAKMYFFCEKAKSVFFKALK